MAYIDTSKVTIPKGFFEDLNVPKLLDWLNSQPTADVVEVKHGHWITQEEAEALDRYDLAFCCSACCELNWDCTESESFNFCPNCGAKMNGERRETNDN